LVVREALKLLKFTAMTSAPLFSTGASFAGALGVILREAAGMGLPQAKATGFHVCTETWVELSFAHRVFSTRNEGVESRTV